MGLWWIGLGIVFPLAWLANNWVRARHGYPLEDGAGGVSYRDDPENSRRIALLSDENARLMDRIGRLEERLAVLERIATDPAEHTARAIEALR